MNPVWGQSNVKCRKRLSKEWGIQIADIYGYTIQTMMNVIVCLITLILCIPNCNSYHIQMNSIVWCKPFCNNRLLYVQYLFQNQSFNHIELSHKVVVSTRALNIEFEPQQCILFTQYNSTHTLTAQNSHRLSLYCIFFAPFISTLWIRRRQVQCLVLSKK